MSRTYKITGADAIRLAERENLTIHCYANPLDEGGAVSVNLAQQIAKDDPSLIYVTVTPTGWRDAAGNHIDGSNYHVDDYFAGRSGEYLGPDSDGVEPCWNNVSVMTEQAARRYVAQGTDDQEHDEETLEQVFSALHGRPADDEDRKQGLWSLCCAAV